MEAVIWKGNGPKEFWKVVKQAQRKTKKSKVGPIKDGNDNLLLDDTEKAKCFNDYFASIGEDLAEKYDEIREENLQQYIVRVTPTTEEIQINQGTVRERLDKKLNPKKAMGPDQIAPKDLAMLGDSVEKGLFHVFKESIDTAKYPSAWKVSNLNPVFKKGGVTERANFRPISLLSVPGKLLEDIICKPIDNHMKVQGISSCRQWGFKQGRSTEGLLLHLTEQWKDALDNGFKVGVIFFDFRKAFDTVNHKILKQKLKGVGMNGRLWLEDYLASRSHFTKVNGKLSEARFIEYGAP